MVNAWSLLYSEMNGTMDEDYPIMSKNDEDVVILGGKSSDTITFTEGGGDQSWWADDGYSLTGNPYGAGPDTLNLGPTRLPGGMGEDHISFNTSGYGNTAWDKNEYYANGYDPYPTVGSVDEFKPKPNLKGPSNQKYKEDEGIRDLKEYVSSTYQGHYTNNNSDVQTLDLIHSVGDAESFCRSNAIKYLSRYDKKGQAKRDILKAMHYCLLLYYFSGNTNDEITTRGYETF